MPLSHQQSSEHIHRSSVAGSQTPSPQKPAPQSWGQITASSPDEKNSLFDPAGDKVYRHPTFYDIPDEVEHM